MKYDLVLTSTSGQRFRLEGAKVLGGHLTPRRVWQVLTRLDYRLTQQNGDIRGQGTIRISLWKLLRMFAGLTITDASGLRQRLAGRWRFIRHFARTLLETTAWPFRNANVIDPYRGRVVQSIRPVTKPAERVVEEHAQAAPNGKRANGGPIHGLRDTSHKLTTPDGAEISLTRYNGGRNGPVILAPGFGTSTLVFYTPTIKPNIVEYLVAADYDVWLLDYRGSDRSTASRTQFSLDDIVQHDFPLAVSHVMRTAEVPDVQFLGHCVGSVSLMMALIQGMQGVRSAICSQFFLCVEMPWINRLLANLRIAELLDYAGFEPIMTPDFDKFSPRTFRAIDRLLHFYPSEEQCRSPVCRRTLFFYGETFQHRLLNSATHDAVYDMFDRANLKTFKHLTRMTRRRRAVSFAGEDIYLDPEKAKRLTLPITLLQGENNGLFLRRGGLRTIEWLHEHGGFASRAEREEFYRLVVLPDYGHMDTFMGKNAAKEAFPAILRELELGDQLARSPRRESAQQVPIG